MSDQPKRAVPKRPKPHLKLMKDMTEPELGRHFKRIMFDVDEQQPDDVIGSMVITFTDCGIAQYVASIDPETAPQALRELADRLERRETVKR